MKNMRFKVKDIDLRTGDVNLVVLNIEDAKGLGLKATDRVVLKKGKKRMIVAMDIAETEKFIPKGHMGVVEEVLKLFKIKPGDKIQLEYAKKPESIQHIREKIAGKELSADDINHIIKDIVNDNLTRIEKTAFVVANACQGQTINEILNTTRAIVKNGSQLKFGRKMVYDKHCIGGVPGNRTTPIVIPIVAAAGLLIPKTSSRSITSPAGTADTVEVLMNVNIGIKKIKQVVAKTNACMIWGGAINLAPADDKIIEIEHPLSIDSEGQMIASVLAKKVSVGSKRVLIDIPVGKEVKSKTRQDAIRLGDTFKLIGERLGMEVIIEISEGSSPIGNGIGPYLEAVDVMKVLENKKDAPKDLREKSLRLAGRMLEELARKKEGYLIAKKILESGKALKKMNEIIKAQGEVKQKYKEAKYKKNICARKKGVVNYISNKKISKLAFIAGAPKDKTAGIYLHKKVGDRVKKGEPLFTIYSEANHKLSNAYEIEKDLQPYKLV